MTFSRYISKKSLIILFIFVGCLPLLAQAAVPAWQIVPSKSTLTFTATQNGAPVTGEFKKFTADIQFDKDQLNSNSVKIIVDTNSISSAYDQVADTLKSTEWFDAKKFPQAIFIANKFVKTGDKKYQAMGVLTIRDKALPLTVNFTQDDYTQNSARVSGGAIMKRTAYGVGQGEWADTSTIKDEVKIDFTVTAIKK